MNLEDIILNEISYSRKDEYRMAPHEVFNTVCHLTWDEGCLRWKEGQEELQMNEHGVSVKRDANL